ncbi:MAG TPA: four helix bundle protein [Syntrophorhabdaceae bacterium]|nr:four helix bundle protein [Syntrophorhabdaceae bacterium]
MLTIKHFRDLEVYKKAFMAAMKIYEISKGFPKDETYSLINQIRRSSRSVCSNLAESWRKRRYKAVFRNKITDAMQEASETQSWLEFSFACKYINKDLFNNLDSEYEEIIAMLNGVEKNSDKFCF